MEDNCAITTRNLLRALVKIRIENNQDIDVAVNQFKKAYKNESEERAALLGSTIDEVVAEAVKDFAKDCEFCKSYSQLKEIDLRLEAERPKPNYEKRYFAQLVTRYWNSKYEQYESWVGYDTVDLKYCPLCGKKLKR